MLYIKLEHVLIEFIGPKCESIVNPCVNNDGSPVCLNSATCQLDLFKPPYYKCKCRFGFYGTNCQFFATTTRRITTKPVDNSCVDIDPDTCYFYSSRNLCSSIYVINGIPIPKYCAKSCSACSNPDATCFDLKPDRCFRWSNSNGCARLANLVPHPCKKSCNLC